jgi:surface-anchored protein
MTRRALVGAAAALALLTAAAPAQALRSITLGHVDVLDVDYASGTLSLDLRDGTVSPVDDDVDPATVELHALPASKTTVPSTAAYAFLGTAGSDVWILPQQQNANVLWPGWSTEDVAAGALVGNTVSLTLVSATGPGQVALYTTNTFGTPTVKFNTADGLPDSFAVAYGTHAHGNWAFKAAGTYTLTFRATATAVGGAAKDSGLKTYTFVVGS